MQTASIASASTCFSMLRLATYSGDTDMAPHAHDADTIGVPVSGFYLERIRGRRTEHRLGDILFCPAGETHSQYFAPGGMAKLLLTPTAESRDYLSHYLTLAEAPFRRADHLIPVALRLATEMRDPDPQSGLIADGLGLEILGHFARASSGPVRPARWLLTARDYVHANAFGPLSLAAVARHVGRDPGELSRGYRRLFGRSVGEDVERSASAPRRGCCPPAASRSRISPPNAASSTRRISPRIQGGLWNDARRLPHRRRLIVQKAPRRTIRRPGDPLSSVAGGVMARTRIAFMLAAALLCATAATAQPAGRAWLDDYRLLKASLERDYANLAWYASPSGGVDLPRLDRRTRAALESAEGPEEARAAIREFVGAFGDGHFSILPQADVAEGAAGPEPEQRDLSGEPAEQACAALGYASRSQIAFSLPFESLPGFTLIDPGHASSFRAGLLRQSGRVFGILRIRNFSPSQYPAICARPGLPRGGRAARRGRLHRSRAGAMAERPCRRDRPDRSGPCRRPDRRCRLQYRRQRPRRLGAAAVHRLPLRSARLLMTAGPLATRYLDEEIASLETACAEPPTALPDGWRNGAGRDARAAIGRRRARLRPVLGLDGAAILAAGGMRKAGRRRLRLGRRRLSAGRDDPRSRDRTARLLAERRRRAARTVERPGLHPRQRHDLFVGRNVRRNPAEQSGGEDRWDDQRRRRLRLHGQLQSR